MKMTTITTNDNDGGSFFEENRGGFFGMRRPVDRRFWIAWAATFDPQDRDCNYGVMDDFGTLVSVPRLPPQPQQ